MYNISKYEHDNIFQLTDKTIDIPLNQLDLINITYYKSKTDYLDIYDTNFLYLSSILPLCTSILECPPKIINGKKITTPYGDLFYSKPINSSIVEQYPSFYCDIEKKVNSVFAYKKILKKSLDYNNSARPVANTLVRFYMLEPIQSYLQTHVEENRNTSLEKKDIFHRHHDDQAHQLQHSQHSQQVTASLSCCNEKNHLSEYNVTVFLWEWEFIRFLIIINIAKSIMTLHVNINITEKNTLISSKREFINDKLKTIGKIIYYISNK